MNSRKIELEKVSLSHIWILQTVFNTLTPDDKYSRRNMQIFWQQFQTLLYQKEKIFRGFFIAFQKFAWNLEHSQKKKSILA